MAQDVKRALHKVFGEGDWNEVGKGLFDHDGLSIEASIGTEDAVDTVTLDFWKSGDPLPSLRELCSLHGWQAWDLGLWRPVSLSAQSGQGYEA